MHTEKDNEADLADELRYVREHLQEALKRARNVGNFMIESLIREALEEVETALDQMPPGPRG